MTTQVLFVDDEAVMRESSAQWLQLAGFEVALASDAEDALAAVGRRRPDVVVSDIRMPGVDGVGLMRRLHADFPHLPVVLLTAHGDVALAVDAMRGGAFDFLEKPYDPDHLVEVIRKAGEFAALSREIADLRAVKVESGLEGRYIGRSRAAEQVRREIATLAGLEADVIVVGETGCGKEVVARALHDLGRRAARPFVAVNCAAIPADMAESELFGHEAGAFTGARSLRVGKFEHASGGTVLLDEIESMPLALQAKVLRVLQEREVERLGSNRRVSIDVRVVAAAKEDLAEASAQGRFRADLYYRLNVAEIRLPPLRERIEDIPLLFARFVEEAAQRHGRQPGRPVTQETIDRLLGHPWPGNVRELKTVAERFALGLPAPVLQGPPTAGSSLGMRVGAFERALILSAIVDHDGDMTKVALALDLPRRTLNEKMTRLGIARREVLDRVDGPRERRLSAGS